LLHGIFSSIEEDRLKHDVIYESQPWVQQDNHTCSIDTTLQIGICRCNDGVATTMIMETLVNDVNYDKRTTTKMINKMLACCSKAVLITKFGHIPRRIINS
jgi:hypothetical protein